MSEVHYQGKKPEPIPEPVTGSSTIEQVAENETASQLACIWEKLLGIESVGLDQNYFDLGGDSALTIQLFYEIEKIFKVKLPAAILFDAPTVRELARILHREGLAFDSSPVVEPQSQSSRPAALRHLRRIRRLLWR
jgi:acyl carrier protein